MQMIALILTVCAVSNATDCRDETFYFESNGSVVSCMFEAQPYIAEWSATHPKWKVKAWKCDTPSNEPEL
jgi:hypothetical protein